MMLEDELAKRPFMRQGGAFSIQPGSRSMIDSLNYAAELLKNPENMLLLYPQGKIHSLYETDIQFGTGINHILKKAGPQVQVIGFVVLLDFLSRAKPRLRFYLQEMDYYSETDLNQTYRNFYDECIQRQKDFVVDAEGR